MRPIITVVFTPSPGRQARRHSTQTASMLAVNKVPLLLATSRSRHTNFNLVGVEFGRHVAAVELSSAWLVRVSDEPGAGTTDYCCTFTAKGAKERPKKATANAFINVKYRESFGNRSKVTCFCWQEEGEAPKCRQNCGHGRRHYSNPVTQHRNSTPEVS